MEVRRYELGAMGAAERRGLLRSLEGIACKNDQNEGVGAAYIKGRLRDLRRGTVYGHEGGVLRRAREAYVLFAARRTRSAEPVATAYALVCDGGPAFHRLRAEHVEGSVYLALLCGRGASHVMRALVERYTERGVAITLEALPHVLTYYVRPKMPPTVMIDTERAFVLSRRLREAPDAATARRMLAEIRKGEAFVPVAECAFRGRVEPAYSYELARLVVLPDRLAGESFASLCYESPGEMAADAQRLVASARTALRKKRKAG
jgi:hypothetical protein